MHPTGLDSFLRLAREFTLVPLSRQVMADLETPVAAFWKLRQGQASFLLESVEGGENWARYTLLGTSPARIITATGSSIRIQGGEQTEEIPVSPDDRFGTLGRVLDRYVHERVAPGLDEAGRTVALPRFHGGLVGAVSYDAVRQIERIPDRHKPPQNEAAELVFLETRQVLAWDNLKHRAQLVELIPTAGADEAELIRRYEAAVLSMDQAEARLEGPLPPLPSSADPAPAEVYGAIDDRNFGQLVEKAREYIAAGDIIQVVLSRRFLQARRGLHPFLVYRTLRALNPSPYMFYLELPDRTLVGASPELLVRRSLTPSGARGEVRPIAGTRSRGQTTAEDEALATELRADPKEVAEHVMLVDLGRNDLGRIAEVGSVEVDELMVIERYSHVMHLVSHVSGTLRPDVTPAETLAATFPAGTLSGAPKIRAMEIIDELEKSRRGFYGGAVGTIGVDGTVDLAIAIRTLIADDSTFAVQAGAGVVWDSIPEAEAEETHKKARVVLTAIDLARKNFFRPRSRA
jgi:anthranilate synthase component 1